MGLLGWLRSLESGSRGPEEFSQSIILFLSYLPEPSSATTEQKRLFISEMICHLYEAWEVPCFQSVPGSLLDVFDVWYSE